MNIVNSNKVLGAAKSVYRRFFAASPALSRKREIAGALAKKINETNKGPAITYLNIGSSGGTNPDWQWLINNSMINTIKVDMADDWSKLPRKTAGQSTEIKAALGDRNCTSTIFITRHPACSSCLKPNFNILKDYKVRAWFEVIREEQVKMKRFEDLAKEKSLPQPQIVKIDVQGFEGAVLRGMGRILDSVLCLEFECHLKKLYCKQETFFELYDTLISKGFILRDLVPQGPFGGEAVEFNSFWSRKTKDARESEIVHLWEVVNDIWLESEFEMIDARQRTAYHFND